MTRLRGQRHDEERAGRRTAGVRRQPRGRSSGTAPTRRSERSAVEEVLRWSTPVAFWTRSTKVDVEMDGVTIPKGERVVSMLRSANRDEEVFGDPFTFDIGRTDNPHVTFGGGGPHHCLGAMLARAEIRAVLDELLCRADDISLGPAKGRLPQPDEQHVDLRRDGDLRCERRRVEMRITARCALRRELESLRSVPITPCAASRSRSASVSPHSSVSTSALCSPSVGGGRCSQLFPPSSGANGGVGYRPSPVRGWSRRSKKPRWRSCGFSVTSDGETTAAAGIPAPASTSTTASRSCAANHSASSVPPVNSDNAFRCASVCALIAIQLSSPAHR